MTTARDHYDMPPTPEPLQLLLRTWLQQTGAVSALPAAPVVPDRPARGTLARRWLVRRRAQWLVPTRASGEGAASRPAAVARGC
jgi:hypothetical protein